MQPPKVHFFCIDITGAYPQYLSMGKEEMQTFVNNHDWVFAKTYAAICPHEYIVKSKLDPSCQATFEEVVSFIREAGFEARYKGHPGIYYILDGHYYWIMDAPIKQTTILNRAKLIDYTLFDNSWVWKGK